MQTGKIAEVHKPYHFGFIKDDGEAGDEYYYHASALADGVEYEDLKPGDKVSYEVIDTKKGKRAVKVGPVKEEG